jgi:hypothetical protein
MHRVTTKDTLCNRPLRSAPLALAAFGVLFAATGARAGCGDPAGSKPGFDAELPVLADSSAAAAPMSADDAQSEQPASAANPEYDSIVGLWHVKYTSDGVPFYESFDEWHSDGTEFEDADLPAVTGNVCVGTWKQIGPRSVRLYHIGWNYDSNGNPNGTFTLLETNTLGHNGETYAGTFDYKVYDVSGNEVIGQEVKGTQAATRITVK